jgi:hypothetical protein
VDADRFGGLVMPAHTGEVAGADQPPADEQVVDEDRQRLIPGVRGTTPADRVVDR